MALTRFSWNVKSTLAIIRDYERYEFLWNEKHPQYKNRNRRQETYGQMARTVSIIEPGCTTEDVRKKINSLRSQYLAEKNKIKKGSQSGVDGVKSTLYWYPLMAFLEKSTYADNWEDEVEYVGAIGNNSNLMKMEITSYEDTDFPEPDIIKKSDYDSNFTANNTDGQDDEFDIFGKFISNELRSIRAEGGNRLTRQAKRKIQQAIMNTWDFIDSQFETGIRTISSPFPTEVQPSASQERIESSPYVDIKQS